MTDKIEFIISENPEETEKLFRSMSHEELVANCVAASQTIQNLVEVAELNRRRAEVITDLGRILEKDRRLLFEAMQKQSKGLDMAATELAGREKRKDRAELYMELRAHAAAWMERPPSPIQWPADIGTLKIEEEPAR